jgi:type IV pilus assembly protein PilE
MPQKVTFASPPQARPPSVPLRAPLVSLPFPDAEARLTSLPSQRGFGVAMTIRLQRAHGFTLIEMMIVCVIVAILAAIALPSYFEYITRSRIIDGTTKLGDYRTRLEKVFLDNRRYDDGAGKCLNTADVTAVAKDGNFFDVVCTATPTTYLITATGAAVNGMDVNFVYTVDQLNNRTSAGPAGWTSSGTCWILRKDGSC